MHSSPCNFKDEALFLYFYFLMSGEIHKNTYQVRQKRKKNNNTRDNARAPNTNLFVKNV